MNTKLIVLALVLAFACSLPKGAHAQSCSSTNVTENFTGTTTSCSWYYIGGACLTASTTPRVGQSGTAAGLQRPGLLQRGDPGGRQHRNSSGSAPARRRRRRRLALDQRFEFEARRHRFQRALFAQRLGAAGHLHHRNLRRRQRRRQQGRRGRHQLLPAGRERTVGDSRRLRAAAWATPAPTSTTAPTHRNGLRRHGRRLSSGSASTSTGTF